MDPETSANPVEMEIARALDEGALDVVATQIVSTYGPGILGFLMVRLNHEESAREVFSAFAEELWKALPRFERRSSAKTWAYAIAHRVALRRKRDDARAKTRPLRDSEHSKLAAAVASVSQSLKHTENEQRLAALRASLTEDERTLLVLRIDRAMSWQDIAIVMKSGHTTTPAALRKRFERLKTRLRDTAEKQGLVERRGTE